MTSPISTRTPGPSLQHRIYDTIHDTHPGDDTRPFRIFNGVMLVLICANVIAIALETEKGMPERYGRFFETFEIFSVAVFAVEYVLRIWVCPLDPRYNSPVRGRIRFALTPLALIDLLAIAPFFMPFLALDLRFIRSVRFIRMFRVAKLGHYSRSVSTLAGVVRAKKEELLVTLFSGGVVVIIASCLIYLAESHEQPETFSSIPAAMWWAIETLTTVDYGDIYPKTVLGKLIGSVIAVLGICLLALPAGIITAGFVERITRKRSRRVCPQCGHEMVDED